MLYLIAYDISEQLFDYSSLKEEIKTLGDYQHPLESVWFVDSDNEDIDVISSLLKEHLKPSRDHLYIMEVQKDAKRQGFMQKTLWNWLRKKLN